MLTRTKWFCIFLFLFTGFIHSNSKAANASDSLTLYTPYTKISVPPGESVEYTIDVINNSSKRQNADISVSGMPKGWNYYLKSGGWSVGQLSVLPGERKSLSFKVDIPFQVEKGNYRFSVFAGKFGALPLVVNVSKQGVSKSEFTATQSNMQGQASSTFTFTADLKNRTAEKQLYSLIAQASPGWSVIFKADFKQVTSVDIEANRNINITIEINPPAQIDAGKYKIPVTASTNGTSTTLELEVVITGSYKMELTTPTGLLSTKITAGDKKQVDLLIKNTGSSELSGIDFSSSAPTNWEVTFEPKKINQLLPGSETHVYATIKADKKAIPGDYVTNIEAKTPEVISKASFRISVETPMLWGWIGVLVIIIALGSVYYLFRKYGRR
jgi:uncharacterized membrane protein